MKNLTRSLLTAAVLACPVVLVQAADPQPAPDQQAAPAEGQQAAPAQEQQTAPAPSEQGNTEPNGAIPGPGSQDEGKPEQSSQMGAQHYIEEQSDQEMLASELMGYAVTNPQNENIGHVSDLLLDQNQRPVGMVIAIGGFLGIGAKHVALPMDMISIDRGNKVIRVNLSKEQLTKAPTFKTLGKAVTKEKSKEPASTPQ